MPQLNKDATRAMKRITTREGLEKELGRQKAVFLKEYSEQTGEEFQPEVLETMTRAFAFNPNLTEMFASVAALQWMSVDFYISEGDGYHVEPEEAAGLNAE